MKYNTEEERKEAIRLAKIKYYEANKEAVKLRSKNFSKNLNKEQKEAKRLYNMTYREINKESISVKHKDKVILKNLTKTKKARKPRPSSGISKQDYHKAYNLKNRENKNTQKKIRYKTNTLFKLTESIRNLISISVKRRGYSKTSKTSDILGCSYEDFKTHIESQFQSWMNWENKGNWNGIPKTVNVAWDIDHIIPLDTAKCEADVIRLNHWTNLQPLCSYTNRIIKRNNY